MTYLMPKHATGQHTGVKPLVRCEPYDDRCAHPSTPTFYPGISVRHSPSCTGQMCNLFECDGGNWRVTNRGTLDRSEWIKGWIMTQLLTRGLVDCDQHPLGRRDGGWWADAFRTPGQGTGSTGRGTDRNRATFKSGSKLWSLQWRHGGATNDLLLLAQSYAYEALNYLLSWGIVSALTINAVYVARGNIPLPGAIIELRIKVTGPGVDTALTLEGAQMPDSTFLWEEYRPPRATGGLPGRYYQKAAVRP